MKSGGRTVQFYAGMNAHAPHPVPLPAWRSEGDFFLRLNTQGGVALALGYRLLPLWGSESEVRHA